MTSCLKLGSPETGWGRKGSDPVGAVECESGFSAVPAQGKEAGCSRSAPDSPSRRLLGSRTDWKSNPRHCWIFALGVKCILVAEGWKGSCRGCRKPPGRVEATHRKGIPGSPGGILSLPATVQTSLSFTVFIPRTLIQCPPCGGETDMTCFVLSWGLESNREKTLVRREGIRKR